MITRAAFTTRHVVAALTLAMVGAYASAAELTVVNFGGSWGQVQKPAFYDPFEKSTGNKITVVEYNGETAKVKAMVEAKAVNWDVVEVESGELNRGCDDGLYEELDWSKIAKKSDLVPGAAQNAASASWCGRWRVPITPTNSRLRLRAGQTFGMSRNSRASAGCAKARGTTSSSR